MWNLGMILLKKAKGGFLRKYLFVCAAIFIFLKSPNHFVFAQLNLTNELEEVVAPFLPKTAELIEPTSPLQTRPILPYDFDQDGQKELVVIYKEKDDPNKQKAMLLKKEQEQWKKIWEKTGEGFDIHLSALTDITGDGIKEYVIGWMIGESAGNQLEIFQWQNHTLKKIFDYPSYQKIEFLTGEKQTYLAIWKRFCCDAYTVDVLGWNGTVIDFDQKMFAEYYPKIEEFYANKIKQLDAWYYWYALADAQIKANFLDEARASIQKGFSFNLANKEFAELQKRLEKKLK